MFAFRYVLQLHAYIEDWPNILQTSLDKTGSDAMNAAGDYSAAYCILHTDSEFEGHGMVCLILVF
jgi:hypothetical protein